LGLRNVCPSVHNCSKYQKILQAVGDGFKGLNYFRLNKLDLTGNILLHDIIANFVIFYVQELKLSQNDCYLDIQDFIILADKLVTSFDKQNFQLRKIYFHRKSPLMIRPQNLFYRLKAFWFRANCLHEFVINMRLLKFRN